MYYTYVLLSEADRRLYIGATLACTLSSTRDNKLERHQASVSFQRGGRGERTERARRRKREVTSAYFVPPRPLRFPPRPPR